MSTSLKTKPALHFPTGSTLLDQIDLKHGPIALLGRFFLLAEQAARDRGVYLRLHTDMAWLTEVYPEVLPGRTVPALPIFDPAHSDLSPENAFWISGRDESGMIVATQAARLLDMTQSSVSQEFTALRPFFAAPDSHLASGMRCLVDCPPADGITGRVIYSGCAVYHPTIRGCGISRILPRISRALAYSTWNSDYTISLLEPILIEKNVHVSYGYTKHSKSIKLRGTNRGDVDSELVWMPTSEMLEDIASYTSGAVGNDVRSTETTDTNWLEPRRHGSSSRS